MKYYQRWEDEYAYRRPRKGAWIEIVPRKLGFMPVWSPPQGGVD